MPDKNTQFTKQQRFYKLHEEMYLTMMQSKAQFEITQAGSTPDFKILSSATLPTVPISPRKYLILGIGLVTGIVLNFFFIGALYLLNNKITSVDEIERSIQVPVLGAIPESFYLAQSPFHVLDNPKSMVSEAIRTLRTNLDFFTTGEDKKIIAISSTISGEGKSFLALNLGGILAASNKKVALLNLDMRKQRAALPFEVADPGKGISTILIKKHHWKDCVIKTPLENLDYIPSGPHPPNPSELLLDGTFPLLLQDLRREYDFIVLDTPPIGLVTDGTMAMKQANLCIYVFRANYSKKEFIQSLRRMISINKFANLAIVVNALPVSSKAYGYGYYDDRISKGNKFKKILNA
jgi:capsular exopolysaccharide synthesis family protein